MSWLKFWSSKKSKSKDIKDEYQKEFQKLDGQTEAEKEKNKLRHSLSISRSGRFKSKSRQRSGILDKPELFDGSAPSDESASSASQNQHPTGPSRSPNNTCRDMRQVSGMHGFPAGRTAPQQAAV
ncbi:hypothetical protein KP79_PYT03645 [Mizuhopecten yessoensis]|uniref:Uncharacterized protein n=1 Tax=Mizuhopecten yessoensis TaxID=6573 RepID=A0A210R515_MIZYE|nr:hypothetical protein KP79_PYT03645 [Mizuhopecten yessoensis]